MRPLTIRPFESHADRAQCVALQELTWGAGFTERIPAAMLLVAQKTGGVCAGAFDDTGRMLGFVFGVTGVQDDELMHWSDMLAVHPDARGQHLGERLKEHQRAHCRALGIRSIYWTYDPLVARNAHLNLSRMGARVVEFVPAMYGEGTNSPLQGDMPTDRFVVAWAVDPAAASPALAAVPADTETAVDARAQMPRADGTSTSDPDAAAWPDAARVVVRAPRDISALAAADIAAARRWRFATRAAFTHYLGAGYGVAGFRADADGGSYLLTRSTS
ncbi:MAG TPA: GNAT family N-acetyltransferase [Gemmatimonadaceae bacterium]|nr:GNAT family N-acetyltransferase [Gemmatimonadaceae bacterium]